MRRLPLGVLPWAMLGMWLLVGWTARCGVHGEQPQPLDQRPPDNVSADPQGEADREPFDQSERQGRAAEQPDKAADDLQQRLQRELGAAAQSEDDNPLLAVAQRMREVQQMLGRDEVGPATQDLQQQIVAQLDELIKQARQGGGPGSRQPQQSHPGPQPGQTSGPEQTPTGAPKEGTHRAPGNGQPHRPDMRQMRDLIKRLWGELPQRDRPEVSQSPPEEFLPKYELLIEEYFRRLAEERSH